MVVSPFSSVISALQSIQTSLEVCESSQVSQVKCRFAALGLEEFSPIGS